MISTRRALVLAAALPVLALAAACAEDARTPSEPAGQRTPIDTFAVGQRAPIDTFAVSQRAPIDTFAVAQRAPIDTLY